MNQKCGHVAIVGAPNAGKSSLLNSLAGDDKAIVSDQPGTTRDIVEVRIDIDGVAVTFADTAGLRADSDDAIEKEGMRRTAGRARSADVRLWMIDVSRETVWPAVREMLGLGGCAIRLEDHRMTSRKP